jgi:hypothetical protein
VAVAPLAAPVSFTSANGVLRDAPAALFQFAFATTPAISVGPIAVPVPTKLMLTTPTGAAFGFRAIVKNTAAAITTAAASFKDLGR